MFRDIVQPTRDVIGYGGILLSGIADPTLQAIGKPEDVSISKWITGYNFPTIPPTPSSITPTGAGKTVKGIISVGQYFVPYYGEAMIYGGIGEATVGGAFGGEKSLQSYIKSHPVETLLVGAYSGIKVYPFASGYLRTLGREKLLMILFLLLLFQGSNNFGVRAKVLFMILQNNIKNYLLIHNTDYQEFKS